ncbi:hypothetical protein [Achromobacter sp.]|uniref:hypothetical protein n=1 Tax=Achromobacter sp. TaxID=134375 RepID=UPI003C791D7D
MQTIPVRPKTTPSPALALASWEPEGGILSCSVEYPFVERREQGPEYPLRDFLDQQWPQPETAWIIDAGSLTLDLDDRKRLVEVYLRTNPADWILQPIQPAQGDVAEPFLEAPFEADGRVRCQPIQEAQYDPQRGIVCLSWGDVDHWCIIAPRLALGLAADGGLTKIQMSEFWIPVPKTRGETTWERVKRKLGLPADRAR